MTCLPSWATAILDSTPKRGDGLNRWLLRAAIALRRCDCSERDIESALVAATAGETLQPNEIGRAVARSKDYMTSGGSGTPVRRATRWPSLDTDARQRAIDAAAGYSVVDLFEESPWRFSDDEPMTEAVIDLLFPGNPLLCVGTAINDSHTRHRETWRGKLAQLPFIVPSAMAKPIGKTQDGHDSERCLENVGPRRFLVVEQDSGTPDDQAAILRRLAELAPLAVVVRSGGKSLHGWFRSAGASEQRQRQFFAQAVRLGADPATWTLCQLVRMPDGWRAEREQRQNILFFAPEVCE